MDATGTGGERRAYTTPEQVQAWFLRTGRDKWRRRAGELEAEVAALREQRAAGGK